ncbi:uncharacterized protein LOC110443129 [Mizuhopecten yessoensis]|uniref:F-box/LRR-repeat protein 2 n=1 Tax=Mizuhopecten yessoensis TaxID=6573 RepID=A0A210PFL1_MIZYE|nr:uncharacterized protein LOC110443129 [Mizuhopecten yessoensis]XP_021342808.1 uncharacterized protein LOC110443129 [Mizuhopecten yessoensis]XP_021342810.1 uncharacterized protein LOC110443129 [Mizuhopecten yessoensis]XP_021342811.1 uncharacterized protein LOC110443129 [Mizuhopecten yessoensis]OWF35272.1 F-box/LRR-repeat protein 2 [Mizuhopecten yessoensis]
MANVVPLKFTAKLICIQTLLDLSGDGDREAAQMMLKQLQTGRYTAVSCGLLRRLVDRHPAKVTNSILSALASTHLRELKLKKCKYVSFTGLKNVLETCPLVTKLDLSECDQFSQPEVFHITSFLRPGITSLSLENCLTVNNTVVQSILLYMKTLQHLNLASCSKLTDTVFLLNENLQLQRETFGQMSQDRYDCALISVDISCTTLTSTAVRHLATLTGPTLKHVNISWTAADTLALLYLSGYGRPAIVHLTLSDPDSDLDGPLKQSLLELKNTLNQLKLGMLRRERSRKGNYVDIPFNETTDRVSLTSSDPQLEVRASPSSSKGHPGVTASLSSTNTDPEAEVFLLSKNTCSEISGKMKTPSQPRDLQNNDKAFKYEDDPEAGHHLQSSDIGAGVNVSEWFPSVNINGVKAESGDNRLPEKSFLNILEEASESDGSVDSTMEEGEDSDTGGSVQSDEILSEIETNGHVDSVMGHLIGGNCVKALASDVTVGLIGGSSAKGQTSDEKVHLIGGTDAEGQTSDETIHLIGGTDAEGQTSDEMIHLIGESDVDDLTSDVTVHVSDDSYSWTVDNCSHNTPDTKLSTDNKTSCCEVCSKLKSNIAKCTESLNGKRNNAKMSAVSRFSYYTSKPNKHSQNSQTSESSKNTQFSGISLNSETSEISQISHINGFSQNILSSDLSCFADSGNPQELTQSVILESKCKAVPPSTIPGSPSDLENGTEERVEMNLIDDDTGITYSVNENVKSVPISETIPASGEESVLPYSDDNLSVFEGATCTRNEGVVFRTSSHGDGMTFDEAVPQQVEPNKTKCDDVMISDETGVPLVMSCVKQDTCSELTTSDSGACADVQYSNRDKSSLSGSGECDIKSNPSVLQRHCQTEEVCGRNPFEPGAFFDLQEQSETGDVLNVSDSASTEKATVMTNSSSDLNDQDVPKACLSDKPNRGCKSLDDQGELEHFSEADENSEVSQSQNTSGYLDESGEYCHSPANPPDHEPKSTNSHKNSENGEIENRTEPHVNFQFYKPDLLSIYFKKIEFENTYKYNGLKCLKMFSTENKNLQKIKISWKDNLKSSMLEELAPLWPNITYISLSDCESLTSQSLVTLATNCKQIQTITLQGVTFIQDFAMIPFITNGCLECLNLAECRITDHTLVIMARNKMDKMKELDLSWCDDTSSVGLDQLFGKCSDTLRKLSIRQLAANDNTLSLIASNFSYLTSLNMSSIDGISDDAVVNLVENIRTLEHVDFSWNLGVSNRSISALLKNCQRLQRADLAGLKTITSEPFLPLISDLRQWRRCQALLRLKLHERSAAAAAADVGSSSDEEYADIFLPHRSTVYATDLNYLNLEFCDQVSDNHLAEISIVSRRESLTIYNYYGELVKPELFVGQGRQWYSNYIPATDE